MNNIPIEKKENISSSSMIGKIIFSLITGWILFQASSEFYEIAWGTGTWNGEFSRTWAFLYFLFTTFCVLAFLFIFLLIWYPKLFASLSVRIISIRKNLGNFRWVLWIIIFIFPIWFFQYTAWGVAFQKLFIRILVWGCEVTLLTLLASNKKQIFGWNEFLTSLVLTASAFSIIASLKSVNNYPFSLGWSEGNRLWDYSILFGRDLYIYPSDKRIFVLLDLGRQFVGGLPFLFSNITISIARLWVGLTLIIPYLLLGLTSFRLLAKEKLLWLLAILWVFLFLKQGPIHAPLVIVATFVILSWRSPYWLSIPLMVFAGYIAQASRFTWTYAPPLWIFMLEVAYASFSNRQLALSIFKRASLLVFSALFGAFFLVVIIKNFSTPKPVEQIIPVITETPTITVTPTPEANVTDPTYFELIVERVTDQPLLWYRLLPNSTFENGILLALLLAVGPIITILIYLVKHKIWLLNKFQKAIIFFPLCAFLAVGLIASTKIGGGGDLHNMDMFLVGLLFTSVLAWQNGGKEWIQNVAIIPQPIKITIILSLIISSINPLFEMRSYSFGEDISWLRTLTDSSDNNNLEMLPNKETISESIQMIQEEVDNAKSQGDILFIDQRQLLTFGYINNVPLIPDYEKKLLMNQALSSNSQYFSKFYTDLENQRFSLIISEPLKTPIQDSTDTFGEENNAWVKWVSMPVLCYYDIKTTLREVNVQLLVPKPNPVDCSADLPMVLP